MEWDSAAASRDPYQRVSSDPFRQMQFFETIDYEKYRKMEKTVDQIRKRFGMDSIKRACFLPSAGSVEIFKIIYTVPQIPIIGKRGPQGTLKERGAFGSLFRKISTSI